MYLFIDTISNPATYILFDSKKDIVSKESLELRWRESEHFLVSLTEFLGKNKLKYEDLEGVVVINGPGSFTAMRIITLTINTLSFVHHTPLYSLDYFRFLELSGESFPMMIRANRGEYLLQETADIPPKLMDIQTIPHGSYSWLGDANDFTNGSISIQSSLRYDVFCRNFLLTNPIFRIEPFYIKKANIT